MKKQLSLLLILVLLLSLFPFSAFAEEAEETEEAPLVSIVTAAQFLSFARNCVQESYSAGVRFVLKADLDLSGEDYSPIPYFAGSFDGEGHTIRGVSLLGDGSRQGLFRELGADAELVDLHVEGVIKPGGSRCDVGGIVGLNNGMIRNCSFTGTVEGIENVGGVAGRNGESGVICQCVFNGSLLGEHQVGGVTGKNEGGLLQCTNRGSVNTVQFVPQGELGFDLASFSQDEFLDITNLGGICGENTAVISGCTNFGAVGYKYTGYNVGGIAGKSSGYVSGCVNGGSVDGRRDAGGVVGQLIPYAAWDFSDGRLDALSNEISGMNYLIAQATQNAGAKNAELSGQLGVMNGYTAQAITALTDIMRSTAENDQNIINSISFDSATGQISFPDLHLNSIDTGSLTGALANMYAQSTVLAGMIGDTVTSSVIDLNKITGQMSRIFDVLFSMVSDGGSSGLISTRDLSFSECYEHDEGAVADCSNRGSVRADTNAGGLVGTIAFEIAFDMEDQLNASSFLTSHAEQYLFAAVRGCRSSAEIQTRADNGGGVVGRMDVGAIVDCSSIGSVASQNGSCIGGVAGTAQGTISACWSRGLFSGASYVGGIAGLGRDILDCRAWAQINDASEYCGAVAGWAEGSVERNLYVDSRPAGVDDVSRTGQAEAVKAEALAQMEGAPGNWNQVTLRFLVEGRPIQVLRLPFGSGVSALPTVENRGASFWQWDDFDREHVYADMDIGGSYRSPATTLSSGGDVPQFLVEGSFYEGQSLLVERLSEEQEVYRVTVQNYDGDLTVRMQTEARSVYLLREDSEPEKLSADTDGSYLVFSLPNGGAFLAAQDGGRTLWPMVLCFGLAGLAALGGGFVLIRRKRQRSAEPSASE